MGNEFNLDNMKGVLIRCEHCNRPLIERLPNGLFRFSYGRPWEQNKEGRWVPKGGYTPVVIYIKGNIKMKCFRKDCDQYSVINYTPADDVFNQPIG